MTLRCGTNVLYRKRIRVRRMRRDRPADSTRQTSARNTDRAYRFARDAKRGLA